MRVAGLRTPDGRMVWVDAGAIALSVLDSAAAEVDGERVTGQVYVVPEELLVLPEYVDGILLQAESGIEPPEQWERLPGSEFPPLGSTVVAHGEPCIVEAIDHRTRHVFATDSAGARIALPLEELLDD